MSNLIEQYQKRLVQSRAYMIIRHKNSYGRTPVGTIVYKLPTIEAEYNTYYADLNTGKYLVEQDYELMQVIDSNTKIVRVVDYSNKAKNENSMNALGIGDLVLLHKNIKIPCICDDTCYYSNIDDIDHCPYNKEYSLMIPLEDSGVIIRSCNYVLEDI